MRLITLLGVLVVACSEDAGGNETATTSAGLDVSGASNTPCSLTVTNDGHDMTWAVDAPNPPVVDTSLDNRAPLAVECGVGDAATVNVVGPTSCVSAWRTSKQLCFSQSGCLGSPLTSEVSCPVTLTLVCAGVTFYDHVPWNACRWFG